MAGRETEAKLASLLAALCAIRKRPRQQVTVTVQGIYAEIDALLDPDAEKEAK